MKTIETNNNTNTNNNVNFTKEEKKMKNQYPVAVKVASNPQLPIKLYDLRKAYNMRDNSALYSVFYRVFHGAAIIDNRGNCLYCKDHGYYKLRFVSAAEFKEKAQGIVPKKCTKDEAIQAVQKWTRSKNSSYSTQFLNEVYTLICGHGVMECNDEGFGSRKELYSAAKKYTSDDKLFLEAFDVQIPRTQIFNGYLHNGVQFLEATICTSPDDGYNKGYYTQAISTASYRTYAPKDERLSYYGEREGTNQRQADYDQYLTHSEMSMYDKAATHELAEAWAQFIDTLYDDDRAFFLKDDLHPMGLTNYEKIEADEDPFYGPITTYYESSDDEDCNF